MDAFLNELSLHGQYHDNLAVGEALRRVNQLLARLSELDEPPRLFYDTGLYYARTVGDALFSSSLEHIPDKSVRLQFKLLLQDRLSGRRWFLERRHAECAYMWNGTNTVGSSLAELAERRLLNETGFLLNFRPSIFEDTESIVVEKEGGASAQVDSVSSEDDLRRWYTRVPALSRYLYDPTCGRPPLDRETILIDRGRFSKTVLTNQGRSVYLERSTNHYYCVDNLHGHGAHFEVFNANGDHVGEASLDGRLDVSRFDPTKRLYV